MIQFAFFRFGFAVENRLNYTFVVFPRKATQYLFFEIWPSFVLGLVVFIFILLMFQALRYTEFVLIHGVGLGVMVRLISYMAISFLPALFPMSLLFSVLTTYTKLSQDSELLAMKASGISTFWLLLPPLLIAGLVSLFSAQTSFQIAPWGNRQFEILIHYLGQTKAAASIREGTFSEGFFDLVVYANKIDSKTGQMEGVFIYDERDEKSPLSIVAQRGRIIQETKNGVPTALLRLFDGDIHRKNEAHTKVKFTASDFYLSENVSLQTKEKSPPSLTLEELRDRIQNAKDPEEAAIWKTEMHKRWAVAAACFVFSLLAFALGAQTNKRAQKSGVVVVCSSVILLYWVFYVASEGWARSGQISPALAMWLPNFLFLGAAIFFLKRIWNS